MEFITGLFGLVVLLLVANGSPILARHFLYNRFSWPVDGGRQASDGRPLLGKSKTWRGVITSVLATALTGAALGVGALFGAAFGATAMAGDLFSSYLKRRQGLASSARATGLDQIPEALFPLLLSHWWLEIGWAAVIVAAVIFFLIGTKLSPVLYRLGIRRRPH